MKIKQFLTEVVNKLNPAQSEIVSEYGTDHAPSPNLYNNKKAYNTIEIVNRGTNLIVDSAADIHLDVGDMLDFSVPDQRIRKKKLFQLLNFKPNPYYNADVLKRNIIIDLVLEGDAYIYYDGASLYNLPASSVEVVADNKTYIKEYTYNNTKFKPNEIIHIKENAASNVFVGSSRLDSAKQSINVLMSMKNYQKNFFDNSAVPGIILITPNPLSERVKNRMVQQWMSKYNPSKGGKRPLILDGEFKVESLSKYNFKELDFVESVNSYEKTILKALGVPPILLDSGNNANITPNLKMFYLQTVMPLVNKTVQALEGYFGYDIKPNTQEVLALRPELRDQANFLSTLTNAGIMKRNEAREVLRLEPVDSEVGNDLILPANIAGSAADASVGGAPKKPQEETNDQKPKQP
jgi:HK97 family phage portal protein